MILDSQRDNRDKFTENIESLQGEYRNMFGALINYAMNRTDVDRLADRLPVGFQETFKAAREALPALNSFKHLRDTINVIPAMPLSFKQTIREIHQCKRFLINKTFSIPDDLSNFYRLLRDQHQIMFGDAVSHAVAEMYTVQPPRSHSLVSQLIYAQAMSNALFSEVKDRRNFQDRLVSRKSSSPRRERRKENTDPKNIQLLRMLQEDFDLLTTLQITDDYQRIGSSQVRSRFKAHSTWPMPTNAFTTWVIANKSPTSALYDIPALSHFYKYVPKLEATLDGQKLITNYQSEFDFIQYVADWSVLRNILRYRAGVIFNKKTLSNINSLQDSNWDTIHFSREVPSCQKVFFDETYPLLLCIDPAPSKAYVAAASVTSMNLFLELEKRVGSSQAARDLINPLRKPFLQINYTQNMDGLAFYVRKQDGELCMYGDSNQLARTQLGEFYEPCKGLIHNALYNLTHAEYVEGVERNGGKDSQDASVSPPALPTERGIPEQPAMRTISSSASKETGPSRTFRGRTGHTRLLPSGWLPSVQAWENACKAKETLTLYAKIFNNNQIAGERQLNLQTGGFKEFRSQLLELIGEHGDNVRFQTYVSEATGTNESISRTQSHE